PARAMAVQRSRLMPTANSFLMRHSPRILYRSGRITVNNLAGVQGQRLSRARVGAWVLLATGRCRRARRRRDALPATDAVPAARRVHAPAPTAGDADDVRLGLRRSDLSNPDRPADAQSVPERRRFPRRRQRQAAGPRRTAAGSGAAHRRLPRLVTA